jgi:hypothetical protein
MNVKIGTGNLKTLQQAILDLQKTKPAEVKKGKETILSDLKEISSDSKNLKNIDAERSTIDQDQFQIDFKLVFNISFQQVINAKGFINREEKSIDIHFTFNYERKIIEEEKEVNRKYKVDIHLQAYYEESISLERRIEKEDTLKFIQRVVNEVFDTFNDENKSLRTVFIDKNDLEKIASINKGELARLLQSVIGAVFSLVKYKEMNSSKRMKPGVVLNPQKEKWELKNYVMTKVQTFSLEINQLDKDE